MLEAWDDFDKANHAKTIEYTVIVTVGVDDGPIPTRNEIASAVSSSIESGLWYGATQDAEWGIHSIRCDSHE